MRKAINGVAIEDKRILLFRKRKTWILPGGKPERGGSDIECLSREIGEELPGTEFEIQRYYGGFKGITPHQRDSLRAETYFICIAKLGSPAREIEESRWFSRDETNDGERYPISDITSKVIDSLVRNNYF